MPSLERLIALLCHYSLDFTESQSLYSSVFTSIKRRSNFHSPRVVEVYLYNDNSVIRNSTCLLTFSL